MLNYIWLGLILIAVVLGGLNHSLKQVTDEAFNAAKTAVMTIALPLIGVTALWLGVMRLAEKAGMIQALARWLRPVMRRLFPEVPETHPAMGSMLMNIAANMIGLTNAATPLGLRAMNDLEKLNPHPGVATNAMCTFLAINTSSVQILPTTAIAILAAANSAKPTAIVGTALVATLCSTAVGITAVKLLERLPVFQLPEAGPSRVPRSPEPENLDAGALTNEAPPASQGAGPMWARAIALVCVAFFGYLLIQAVLAPGQGQESGRPTLFLRVMDAGSILAIPFFLSFFPLYAAIRGVRVYEEFVEGAKEGFQVSVRIIPFLVTMLVAVGVFRAAGGVDLLAKALRPLLEALQFPADLLPLSLMRPLSGSASMSLFADLVKSLGPDHIVTRMGGTILGSTETTFYVIAVYFGSVAVKRTRHAVAAGLLADLAGIVASVIVCRMVFAAP